MTIANTRTVNAALKAKGYKAEIVRGEGYWYFYGPDADHFDEQGIYIMYISHQTIEQWVRDFEVKAEEYKEYKDL